MYSITLEVNQICNFSCDYCYLGKLSSKRMDFVTAYQAMEIAFLNAQRHPDHSRCKCIIPFSNWEDFKSV